MKYQPMSESYRHTLIKELAWQSRATRADKDILIVVHNQSQLVKNCLESVCGTPDSHIYLWDNNSTNETKNLYSQFGIQHLHLHNENIGFILPNNELVKATTSPYIILLNSDTQVKQGWAEALIGCLESGYDIAGYQGGLLNDEGIGCGLAWGEAVDYVSGWCMAFRRSLYNKIGLFDEQLQFAYGEDSDFCLRARSRGYKLYALHLNYVMHIGQATIREVQKHLDTSETYRKNHEIIAKRWKDLICQEEKKPNADFADGRTVKLPLL